MREKRKWWKSERLMAPFFLAPFTFFPAQATQNLPPPGSYTLPRIQKVPRASLLDANGASVAADETMRGGLTLLGFFYGHCEDPTGCPVAWSAFESVRDAAGRDPFLAKQLRLMFVSLDPERDTPTTMRLLEKSEKGEDGNIPWSFFTSASEASLAPFLAVMGQDVGHEVDAVGKLTGGLQHMLKVFLIDPDGWVREIYSLGFLTPETVLNDARTLAMSLPDAPARSEPH